MDDLNSFFRRQPLIRGYPECIFRDAQEERCLRVAEAQHTSEDDVTRLHALVELNLNRKLLFADVDQKHLPCPSPSPEYPLCGGSN